MKFYLGIRDPGQGEKLGIPYFLSANALIHFRWKTPLGGDWILDSGGFSQLRIHGKYKITIKQYIDLISRLNPKIAFCQDWMVEDEILERTGLSVKGHQNKTIESYVKLKEFAPETIAPVLQGRSLSDYLNHVEAYKKAGVNLNQVFGLGSVCKKQRSIEIKSIISGIKNAYPELKLHGFGVKTRAFNFREVVDGLYSSDSMAWSYRAFRLGENNNDLEFAMRWRNNIIKKIRKTQGIPGQPFFQGFFSNEYLKGA